MRARTVWIPAMLVVAAGAIGACGSPYEKLTVHRSGGIAGLDEVYSVRKDGIGRIERKRQAVTRTVKLEKRALERIGHVLERLPGDAPALEPGKGFDLMSYELTLEPRKGETRTYAWDDGVRPADAKQESTVAVLRDLNAVVIEEVQKAAER